MPSTTVHVVGRSPLLMANPRSLDKPDSPTGKTKQKVDSAAEAEESAYRNEKGFLNFTAFAFRECLLGGARGRKVGRTNLSTILGGAIFITEGEDFVDLFDPETKKPIKDYVVDRRRIVIPSTGASVMRSRPRIFPWSATVTFDYEDDFTDPTTIAEVLAIGGRTVGVGAFRPAKGGPFGRFWVQ